jgi:thiosulfate/3-mercaptopyruvate sulfurtransferase
MSEPYAHPEALVSADWVQEHLKDPKVRIVESDEDYLLYDLGHIPGASRVDWQGDLQDEIIRDYINADKFAALCSRNGIANDTTVVFYGDKSNWWACYAFWAFTLFGHKNCKVMNGGRKLWMEQGLPVSREVPHYPSTKYVVTADNEAKIRAFRDDVLAHLDANRPSSTSAARRNSPASCSTWKIIRRKARCGAATSREPRTFPGHERSTTMAPSSRCPSSRRFTRMRLDSRLRMT